MTAFTLLIVKPLDKSQADIYKGKKKKCFDYIAEYPLKKGSLSKKAIYYIRK